LELQAQKLGVISAAAGYMGVNWLSGCRLLWEDDGGGSACQGEAKEDWEKAKE
jgi:hypothetical protein